jgi:hypothetical protein
MIDREKKVDVSREPMGIVIARGQQNDAPPRFAAFVWGPVPELDADATTTKAA